LRGNDLAKIMRDNKMSLELARTRVSCILGKYIAMARLRSWINHDLPMPMILTEERILAPHFASEVFQDESEIIREEE
jgi:hypothetical protein